MKKPIKLKQSAIFGSVALQSLFIALNAEAAVTPKSDNTLLPVYQSENAHLGRILEEVKVERTLYFGEYGKCHDRSHGKAGPFGREFGKEAPCGNKPI